MIGVYLSMLDTDEDKRQFEILYTKYRQNMYAVAYSILHNTEDAEDAVHQAFIAIANNFEKIRQIPCQEIKAYIVVIIRNTSIDNYNRNKKKLNTVQSLMKIIQLLTWIYLKVMITNN